MTTHLMKLDTHEAKVLENLLKEKLNSLIVSDSGRDDEQYCVDEPLYDTLNAVLDELVNYAQRNAFHLLKDEVMRGSV